MTLTQLQKRIAREILDYVRSRRLPAGHHLVELHLSRLLNVSRTPVKAALVHLAECGILRHEHNRGFFLARAAEALQELILEFSAKDEDSVYQRLVALKLDQQLPEHVTEIALMRELNESRSSLRAALFRMQKEGWAVLRKGQGWSILPIIDSLAAYEESYFYRLSIETAGLRSSTFTADPCELKACRDQQQYIADGGYLSMTPWEIFEANSMFHETLAKLSGNRFALQSLRRINALRAIVESRLNLSRKHWHGQVLEHLEILDCVERGDLEAAAERMHAHLDGARRCKAKSGLFARVYPRSESKATTLSSK
ncbi:MULTISPECIES: GntR family transcriptional regulator [Pseudomonas]|uniref:DNA-binding GntR family transcriptional regulator n=1 Tax=Phytopseudomonas flavescens TaxID=29435 RepID=A0A7Z0BQS0_9GAMM|nr:MULTISPECIES: GntR family transcriptional regulator [Pseudomonas]MCW2291265.1 DNA-binding GntR family transcriptional regulator [Pseudomonas sp. BIGb0408]NYH74164.1 DNA-binding GntR family transcriptional regulator [Pseudomonas flavescens]